MTAPPTPQPSSAEELAREICNDYFGAPPDGYPEVNPNSKFHLTAILVPLLTPLFTRLQESERVLGECVKAMRNALTANETEPHEVGFILEKALQSADPLQKECDDKQSAWEAGAEGIN